MTDTDEPALPELDPDGLLAELLNAPDRDRCPGARPVVSVAPDDDPAFIGEINQRCHAAPVLERRGSFHGNWAELADADAFLPQNPLDHYSKRWEAARPIVLHDVVTDDVMEAIETDALHAALTRPGGLAAHLKRLAPSLGPEFRVKGDLGTGTDERDLERVGITWRPRQGSNWKGIPKADDLWLKSQRLSNHEEDDSLRVRVSFGEEVKDDASRDLERHWLTASLAARIFPETRALTADRELMGLLGEWVKRRVLLTQAIAYWNAPQGGALFHHDAFDEPDEGRQRGVLYVQLTGATAWLALSTEDLVRRVQEFAALLGEGDFPWLREAWYPEDAEFEGFQDLVADSARCAAELSLPGCGILGHLVNQGPEFTSLLADAGHGFILGEGDAIVLPNHGLTRTCMHSVFCASEETAFSLSLAIREGDTGGRSPSPGGNRRRGKGSPGARRGGSRGARRRGPGSRRRR